MAPPPSNKVFGQSMNKRKNGGTRYQRQFGNYNNKNSSHNNRGDDNHTSSSSSSQLYTQRKRAKQLQGQALDKNVALLDDFSWGQLSDSESKQRRGWLYNVLATTVTRSDEGGGSAERAGVDLYFCTDHGGRNFKTTVLYRPYFYLMVEWPNDYSSHQQQVGLELARTSLLRRYEDAGLYAVQVVHRTDLDQPNHLSPQRTQGRPLLKLVFDTVAQLMDVRETVRRDVLKPNQQRAQETHVYRSSSSSNANTANQDPLQYICDIREYDVPYVMRVCTDLDIRCGTWYTVELDDQEDAGLRLTNPDREKKANPHVFAFDIECTKAPLKFPQAEVDQIFMISYMATDPETGQGQGYLIVSRSVVSQDIADFEYTPKPNYPGPFQIFNEDNEKGLLERFFSEYRRLCPQIVVTYNGDFFDWPFVEARAKFHGLDLFAETGGVELDISSSQYRGRGTVHLDAFHWVQRDSYLPQGSQGLKAVTREKLGYDPVEVDPEDMLPFAQEKPVHMATYSVSDAVATWYLYEKYVHLFIFSLCTIIPMGPEDVLSKGSGTLCEALLMVEAFQGDIICPNKQVDKTEQFHKGHLLENETYIGGKVECLETGVYRADVEYDFDLKPAAFDSLIRNVDRDLIFAIEVEGKRKKEDMVNYEEVRAEIVDKLEKLRDRPVRKEKPFIYHLDVGAMYPNIILTNRLQPSAIVDDAACAACDYNRSKNDCKRRMKWIWRGDYNPATRQEYEQMKEQLSREPARDDLTFGQLPEKEQAELVASRLKTYSRKAYVKTKVTEEEEREEVVCMRENDFYVNTVRTFRDRRYVFKGLKKQWGKKSSNAKDPTEKKQCEDRVLVYDSLQVAHKCILNSFYGYVMRKGARWRSMEMGGIVTKTGADIITQARILVEQIGRPLELDTDGIWCILPKSFPDVVKFKHKDGSSMKIEYPCVMLNADVDANFTNHQYQELKDAKTGRYETKKECSIFFEVDGPYRCMVLPASTEEGRLLKKRYAVFEFDGSLAELKGFELKRRGELELIKTFQSEVFERFLEGHDLQSCYDAVAQVANYWVDVLDTRGETLDDDELIGLISENRSMSRQLEDYGDQKGTAQTTAKRLGEFLGADFIKDKGLACKFIIAEQPYGAPVTERAIPTAIWKLEPAKTKHFLRKWLKAPGLDDDALDIRNVLDWDYYLERLGNTIRKIITIPAAEQGVSNPVPRIEHPAWLTSKINKSQDKRKQRDIRTMFKPVADLDMEDIGNPKSNTGMKRPLVHRAKLIRKKDTREEEMKAANAGDPEFSKELEEEATSKKKVHLSTDNFSDWLKQRKNQWRTNRVERSKAITQSNGLEKRQRTNNVSLQGFVREAANSLKENEWHILEVREMTGYDGAKSGSGDFIVWAMVGNSTLQKTTISIPRTVYISASAELTAAPEDFVEFKRVERILPEGQIPSILYQVSMSEHDYTRKKWLARIKPAQANLRLEDVVEKMYESGMPLKSRALTELGSVVRLKPTDSSNKKVYTLSDFARVEKPTDGEYMHSGMSYKRIFLYVRIHPRTKTGIVAVYTMNGGSGTYAVVNDENGDPIPTSVDITRPADAGLGNFDIGGTCHIWVVKPKAKKSQRNLSVKHCEGVFAQLVETIQESAASDSDYAAVSSSSSLNIDKLDFVDTEDMALTAANTMINNISRSGSGSSVLLVNSSRSMPSLRRHVSTSAALPVVEMPFPPGRAHDPFSTSLPSLNWEQPIVRLFFEAYLYMMVVSYPKKVSYARYGQIPVGCISGDENFSLYEVSMSRILKNSRGIAWASSNMGKPDVGVNVRSRMQDGMLCADSSSAQSFSQDEIWGDDAQSLSPVIRKPGTYRAICVDLDVHDLAIAALTSTMNGEVRLPTESANPTSPNSVTLLNNQLFGQKSAPLGDEMATTFSLSMLKSLTTSWIRDVFNSNSFVADEVLHHIYRIVASQKTLFHEPALHRVLQSLMKSTFMRLLGELQRLGCSIVHASFQKITVATNKICLADAEEHIDFIIKTIQGSSKMDQNEALSRISLRPRQFHSHFVFLDEYNFGTVQLDRVSCDEIDPQDANVVREPGNEDTVIVPSVVSAWSILGYLGSDVAQEYFRAIMGRFSTEPHKKQVELIPDDGLLLAGAGEGHEQLVEFKKHLVSHSFASYLTRAVGEIMRDAADDPNAGPHPALPFVSNVIAILELDGDMESEVQVLKRSLLSQIGVAEYAIQWENPCPIFMLPDMFCEECSDSRDVNLCFSPPGHEEAGSHWFCEDCGTPYNTLIIEQRLVDILHRKLVRYQLQDLRCTKTNRIPPRSLVSLSDCAAPLKTDISRASMEKDLQLLLELADGHGLDSLRESTVEVLSAYH